MLGCANGDPGVVTRLSVALNKYFPKRPTEAAFDPKRTLGLNQKPWSVPECFSIGFEGLAKAMRIPTKGLQRMLGPRGNPTAESLFAVIKVLQKSEHIKLTVTTKRAA